MEGEGTPLRRGMSVKMKKNVIACQPFKNGVSTIICSGCHALMAYPAGSDKVKCSACDTLTTGIKVPCTSCKKPLRLPIKLDNAICPTCGYKFQPISTFRLALPPGQVVREVAAHQIIEGDLKKKAQASNVIMLFVKAEAALKAEFDGANVKCVTSRKLSSNIAGWASKLGLPHGSYSLRDSRGEYVDANLTPEQLKLPERAELVLAKERGVNVTGTHHFVSHQFVRPTDCALCLKFVWGFYKQGKWCSKCHLPVHHKCSKKVTTVCEQYTREACGLSFDDFGEPEDSTMDQAVPEGFPIDEEDMDQWEEICKEMAAKEYRKESYMSTFGKLSDWTDEEIAEMWKRYDTDGNGTMDLGELTSFIGDLTGAEGGVFTDDELKEEVKRALQRMDTNGNGIVEWEEFWNFLQAQKASDFLSHFQGSSLAEEDVKAIWETYDEDGSGELDNDEVRALLRDLATAVGCKVTDLSSDTAGFWELGETVTWDKFKEVFVPMLSETLAEDEDWGDDEEEEEEEEE